MKIRKATDNEKRDYEAARPVYPLYGFVQVGPHSCAIEFPNEGDGNPTYEIMAPDGLRFFPDDTHTLLCDTLEDVRTRAGGNELIADKEEAS